MSPIFSIIVPVYKVEKYLSKCIDSILNQTFADFELLLIDDGSPDRCGEICNRYADVDKRIRVFHKQNEGVSSARNTGLDHACGEWILFVDSDDWVSEDMLEKTGRVIAQNPNIELVSFGVSKVNSIGKSEKMFQLGQEGVASITDFQYNYSFYSCCYFAERVKDYNLMFSKGIKYAEDQEFLIKYLTISQTYYLLPEYFYFYQTRDDSAMAHRLSVHDCVDHIRVASNLIVFFYLHKIEIIHPCVIFAFRDLISAFFMNIISSQLSFSQLNVCKASYHTLIDSIGIYRNVVLPQKIFFYLGFWGMLLCYLGLFVKKQKKLFPCLLLF